jgi:hypothetical protein
MESVCLFNLGTVSVSGLNEFVLQPFFVFAALVQTDTLFLVYFPKMKEAYQITSLCVRVSVSVCLSVCLCVPH